jgi:hypothetical protein
MSVRRRGWHVSSKQSAEVRDNKWAAYSAKVRWQGVAGLTIGCPASIVFRLERRRFFGSEHAEAPR